MLIKVIIDRKNLPKVAYLKTLMRMIPSHKFHRLIPMYIDSFYRNRCDNTPEIVEAHMKEFFPETALFFVKLRTRFEYARLEM